MLIFIYGDDTFRVQEKVKELKAAFAAKFDPTGLNTHVFPASDTADLVLGKVLQAVCSLPFISARRLVVIRDLLAEVKKDTEENWITGLSRTPESTIVIIWETLEAAAVEKKSLFKKLKSLSEVHYYPFPLLEGAALEQWVAKRLSARGGKINPPALRLLVERVGGDLWQMSGEIDKLVSRAGSEIITPELVEDLVSPSFTGEIFALVDAIAKKSGPDALRRLRQERSAGANDFYLFSMLARQIRILLAARSLLDENPRANKQDLATALSLHPFAAQKAMDQAKKFTLTDLKQVHDLFFEYDRRMKSGGIDAGLAVDLITTELLK